VRRMLRRRRARVSSADALKKAQINRWCWRAKETISLINGTQAMLAVGTLALLAAETLVDSADVLGGLCCDALKGTDDSLRRTHSQSASAPRTDENRPRTCARCSRAARFANPPRVRPRAGRLFAALHSASVHGAVRDTLAHCREVFRDRANSA